MPCGAGMKCGSLGDSKKVLGESPQDAQGNIELIMFFKTVVASIIAALLACGVVYFGMPTEPVNTGSVSLRTSSQSSQNAAQSSPQAPKKAETPPEVPSPDERWIDKFVTGPLRRTVRPEPKQTTRPENLGLQKSNAKTWEQTDEMPTQDTAPETPENTIVPEPKPDAKPQKRPEQKAKPESDEPRYYVLEKGELREIDELPVPTLDDAINPNASFRILTVSEQAKLMKQPDLRDRAFLDIVDYALSEELFSASITAMEEIKQVELRDTARSRIAIAYARAGDSRAAFGLIDEVEVEELQDVLRLQVIESMILPERLPGGLQ